MRPQSRFRKRAEWGTTPYGFVRIDGKAVPDPKEKNIIKLMLTYWQSGKSFNAIANQLNGQKIKPRSAKKWDNGTVRKIILKNKKLNKNQTEEK